MTHILARTMTGAMIAALAGCSSIQSRPVPPKDGAGAGSGLVYYLPKKDLLVTVTVPAAAAAASAPSLQISTTPAYADHSMRYVLKYERNAFGKNLLDVGISPTGLLHASVHSKTTSQVPDLAKTWSDFSAAFRTAQIEPGCSTAGEHRFLFKFETDFDDGTGLVKDPKKAVCGVPAALRLRPMWPKGDSNASPISAPVCPASGCSGVFYRQQLPYLVEVELNLKDRPRAAVAQIEHSPSESAPLFLPVERTLFADNDAAFTFDNGIPTQYKQESDGEAIAFLKFPAQVLKAYFEAIGGILAATKNNKTAEAQKVGAALQLELARQKFDLCMAALRAGKTQDQLKDLGCLAQ